MEKTVKRLRSTRQGRSLRSWHHSAIRFHILSAIIGLTIITCFIVFSASAGAFGTIQLFSGPCSLAITINRGLQAVLALLAIGISVSFDYFMRLTSSPTVGDLRCAHVNGRAFDIGVHSIRNLRQISHWRVLLWVILILLAVPIPWLLHSIAFVCFSATDYSRFEVSEAFTTGHDFLYPGVAFLGQKAFDPTTGLRSQFDGILPSLRSAPKDWEWLNVKDCARTYSREPKGIQTHRNVILVVQAGFDIDARGWTGADVWNHTVPPAYTTKTLDYYDSDLVNSLWSFAMYCNIDSESSNRNDGEIWSPHCRVSNDDDTSDGPFEIPDIWDSYLEKPRVIPWTGSSWSPIDTNAASQNISVKYCLSEPYQAPCKIYASNFFLLIASICILLGCSTSVLVSYSSWNKETCQSLGDTLQIFLKDGASFIQMPGDLTSGPNPTVGGASVNRWTPVVKWENSRLKWGRNVSKTTWVCTYVPIGIVLLGGLAVLGRLFPAVLLDSAFGESLSNRKTTLKGLPGFHQFEPGNRTVKLAVYCLTVNAPQLGVSICYFAFTSLYSSLFQGKYWADFATKAQLLRVSFRHGEQQECTPALQFPWVWGLSFALLKAAVGWSMTQTFYLLLKAKVSFWHPEFGIEDVDMFLGYSMRAAFLTIAFISLAALVPFFLSMRSLSSNSLVVGNDSEAIAAHCPSHRGGTDNEGPPDGQNGAITAWEDVWRSRRHLQPLKWGVLNSGSARLGRPGVLGLGTEDEVLGPPVEGQDYVLVAGHFKLYKPTRCAQGV